ncbi:hypothetical protein, partial [Pseudomonas viridiflava]|uniref:hypothetical protein n=1 Tax=Pseudomonas viridiflava TaxID=33069 RepID=UPI00198117B5
SSTLCGNRWLSGCNGHEYLIFVFVAAPYADTDARYCGVSGFVGMLVTGASYTEKQRSLIFVNEKI